MLNEKDVCHQFEKIFKTYSRYGIWIKKIHGSIYTSGVPDYVGCLGGRFVAIEAKGPKGKPRKNQLASHVAITKAGGVSIITDNPTYVATVLSKLRSKTEEDPESAIFLKGVFKKPSDYYNGKK
jgi:hypothetical protein